MSPDWVMYRTHGKEGYWSYGIAQVSRGKQHKVKMGTNIPLAL